MSQAWWVQERMEVQGGEGIKGVDVPNEQELNTKKKRKERQGASRRQMEKQRVCCVCFGGKERREGRGSRVDRVIGGWKDGDGLAGTGRYRHQGGRGLIGWHWAGNLDETWLGPDVYPGV